MLAFLATFFSPRNSRVAPPAFDYPALLPELQQLVRRRLPWIDRLALAMTCHSLALNYTGLLTMGRVFGHHIHSALRNDDAKLCRAAFDQFTDDVNYLRTHTVNESHGHITHSPKPWTWERFVLFDISELALSPNIPPYMCYRIGLAFRAVAQSACSDGIRFVRGQWNVTVVCFTGWTYTNTWRSPLACLTTADAIADRDEDLLPNIAANPHLNIEEVLRKLEYIKGL